MEATTTYLKFVANSSLASTAPRATASTAPRASNYTGAKSTASSTNIEAVTSDTLKQANKIYRGG